MSESAAATEVAAPATPGAVLAAARRAQNLEIAEVARQLRLSIGQVAALEADDHDRLPGPVFVRGFIRNYARLLKVDVEALLPAAASASADAEPGPEPASGRAVPFESAGPRRWPKVLAGLVVTAVAALAAYEFGYNEAPRPAPAASVEVVPPAPVVVDAQPAPVAEPQAVAEAVVPASAPESRAGNEASRATDTVPATLGHYEKLPKPGESRIVMTFDRESWVEIRDRAGHLVFSQVNQAGTEQRVLGTPPLTVVIGNARGVRLTYNGRAVDLAQHTKVDVARLVLE